MMDRRSLAAWLIGFVLLQAGCGLLGTDPQDSSEQEQREPDDRYTANRMMDVWGAGPEDVYVVGGGGSIWHYDGSGIERRQVAPEKCCQAVWGAGPDDIYAVGNDGLILHYDGASWGQMETETNELMVDVWGTGSENVYALSGRAIYNYDGEAWSEHHRFLGPDERNSGNTLWGLGSERIWTMFPLLRFDGDQWAEHDRVWAEEEWGGLPRDIWGTGPDNLYVVGSRGIIRHYDGNQWRDLEDQPSVLSDLASIWGWDDQKFLAVGERDTVVRYEGGTLEHLQTPDNICEDFTAVWGADASNIFVVGGELMMKFDGEDWEILHDWVDRHPSLSREELGEAGCL
jgi:photosystem II stability/assembly factor-like uncharacterized protein